MRFPTLAARAAVVALVSSVTGAEARAATISVQPGQSIQAAIDAAQSGDKVSLGQGVFFEAIDLKGKSIEVVGSGMFVTTIDATGLDSSVVRLVSGEPSTSRLAQLTLTGGTGSDLGPAGPGNGGGGILCVNAETRIENCRMISNHADRGGGIFCDASGGRRPRLVSCLFSGNTASAEGGGAWGGVDLEFGSFVGNRALFGGGAAYVHSAFNTLFAGNRARISGGGVFSSEADAALGVAALDRCNFFQNRAGISGGGCALASGASGIGQRLSRCYFTSNSAPLGGGALVGAVGPAGVAIDNCQFMNNSGALGDGLCLALSSAVGTVTSCTFYGDALGIEGAQHAAKVSSCIFANTAQPIVSSAVTLDVEYCALPLPWPGPGNIVGDPMFVNPGQFEMNLAQGSPCIDAGDPAYPSEYVLDIDGKPRVQNGRVDIGAYETAP